MGMRIRIRMELQMGWGTGNWELATGNGCPIACDERCDLQGGGKVTGPTGTRALAKIGERESPGVTVTADNSLSAQ